MNEKNVDWKIQQFLLCNRWWKLPKSNKILHFNEISCIQQQQQQIENNSNEKIK